MPVPALSTDTSQPRSMSERASAANSCGAIPASSSATSKRSDVERQPRLVETVLEIVAEIRTHHRLAGEIHREHRLRVGPAIAIALHPYEQRANHPAIDRRHAPVALGRVEKVVRGQHSELLRGQADQHLDDQRHEMCHRAARRWVAGAARTHLRFSAVSMQFEQALFARQRLDVAGQRRRRARGIDRSAIGR